MSEVGFRKYPILWRVPKASHYGNSSVKLDELRISKAYINGILVGATLDKCK